MPMNDDVIMRWMRDGGVLRVAGAAGTGKTTYAAKMAQEMRQYGMRTVFSAYTNKAVVNLREKRAQPAVTLHQLLRSPTGFKLNRIGFAAHIIETNPPEAIVLIRMPGQRQIMPPLDTPTRYALVHGEEPPVVVSWGDDGVAFKVDAASDMVMTTLPPGAQFYRLPVMSKDYEIFTRSEPPFAIEYDILHPTFDLKRRFGSDFNTLVVDECSMVDEGFYRDILGCAERGWRVMLVGDPHQLPPVENGESAVAPFNYEKPDIELVEIHRTDCPDIIDLSGKLRRGERPAYGGSEHVQVIGFASKEWGDDQTLDAADQIICGLNKTRAFLNAVIRKIRGYASPVPMVGERLIARATYWRQNLVAMDKVEGVLKRIAELEAVEPLTYAVAMEISRLSALHQKLLDTVCIANGSQWLVKQITEDKPPYVSMILGAFDKPDEIEVHAKAHYDFFDPDPSKQGELSYEEIHRNNAMKLNFAYAITCHNAQGSEYDHVVVVDEAARVMRNPIDIRRWRYTAATRAKRFLTWVTADADFPEPFSRLR
jgi:exodeoxyribonuclease-5